MPFVLLLLGLLLLIVAVRGTHGALFDLIRSEFTGAGNFLLFVAAVVIIGSLGYVRPLKPLAAAFIGLIVLAYLFNNKGGIFKQFEDQIKSPEAPAKTATSTSSGTTSLYSTGGTMSGIDLIGNVTGYLTAGEQTASGGSGTGISPGLALGLFGG